MADVIIQSSLQATPAVPFRQSDASGTNENVNQRSSNKYAPWMIRLSQFTPQTFATTVPKQFGFDTQSFTPTYQALGTNVYSLVFAPFTDGIVYPYSTITLPQYGIYDIRFVTTFDGQSGAANPCSVALELFLNGAMTKYSNDQIVAAGNGQKTCILTDTDIYNPGDQILFKILEISGGGGTIVGINGVIANYLIIRFMGVT